MAGQGRNADGLGTSDTLNVIRFPGDWYGPSEALVPIGADAETDEETGVRLVATDSSADSFWGEDAQAVHQVDELADGHRPGASDISWQADRPAPVEPPAAQRPGTASRSRSMSWRRVAAPIALVVMLAGAVVTILGHGGAFRAQAPAVKPHAGSRLSRNGRTPESGDVPAAAVRASGDLSGQKHRTVGTHTHGTKASATTKRRNLAVSKSTRADGTKVLNDDAGTSPSSETGTTGSTLVGTATAEAVQTYTPPAQTRPATTSSGSASASTKVSSSVPASGNELPSPTGLTP